MRTPSVKQLEKRLSKLEGGPRPTVQRIVVVFGDEPDADSIASVVTVYPNRNSQKIEQDR